MRSLFLVFLAACGSSSTPPAATPEPVPAAAAVEATPTANTNAEAVAHPNRMPEDVVRDADRKPAEVLDFFGVKPGMKVAELMAGRGYYAEILARAVGSEGTVYVQNTKFILDKFAEAPLTERLARPGLEHAVRMDRELDDLGAEANSLDVVMLVLFYHDTYWMELDRPKILAGIFDALKPGGVFGVIDHRAEDGSGTRDVKTLHRVEESVVRAEIEAAGFVLDGSSELLHHAEDARTINVFDDAIRGKTDRFVLRFVKPAAE